MKGNFEVKKVTLVRLEETQNSIRAALHGVETISALLRDDMNPGSEAEQIVYDLERALERMNAFREFFK